MALEWVPLSGYEQGVNLDDRPRKLTSDELNYIAKHMPLAPSADSVAAEVAREGVIDWMLNTLKDVSMCPSAIPNLIKKIQEQHYKSIIHPGTPIGFTAAEAVGATTTQMTLNSVAPHEEIVVQDIDGTPHVYKIGEWIDALMLASPEKIIHIPENRTQYLEIDPVYIATPDSNGKVTWEKVTAVTKHLPVGDLVKITTKSGRSVTVTQSKSLLVHENGKLIQKEGKDAKVGDLVPVIHQFPTSIFQSSELDLKKFLHPKEWLYGSELQKLSDTYDAYSVPGKNKFWSSEDRLTHVPYARGDSALKGIRDLQNGLIKTGFIYPKIWGESKNTKIPEKIKLDKQFGQVIGLYLAEGWATDTFVGISNNAPEIRELVYNWCESVGVTHHTVVTESDMGTSTDIKIHSVLFARLFKRMMNTGSANKIIPPEFLFGNRDFIIGLLDGYFAGDGTVSKRDGALYIGSVSKELIKGFSFLCSRLGIFGKISGKQQESNNVGSKNILYMNTCNIRNKNAFLWASLIGSCHREKDRIMKLEYIRKTEWGICYKKLEDIMLDPIVSIEIVSASEYVYDLTVPSTTFFSLFNGLAINDTFHTSGSAKSASFGIDAMRDLIFARKELKNESCTIYYTNKMASYEEILNTRQKIVGSMMSNFIKDYAINSPSMLPARWWHKTFTTLFNKKIPASTTVLRLFLDTVEMYKHRVSIKDLADVLEREVPPSLVAVYGPIGDGIIDLYPDPTVVTETLKGTMKEQPKYTIPPALAEKAYLRSIVWPELSKIRVKGLAGISNLYPVFSPVWRMVLLERKIGKEAITPGTQSVFQPLVDEGNAYFLFYNPGIMKSTGLAPENLSALCQLAGLTIIGGVPQYLVVTVPNDRFRSEGGKTVIKRNGDYYLRYQKSSLRQEDGKLYRELNKDLVKPTLDGWVISLEEAVVVTVPETSVKRMNKRYYLLVNPGFYEDQEYLYEPVTDPKMLAGDIVESGYRRIPKAEIVRNGNDVYRALRQEDVTKKGKEWNITITLTEKVAKDEVWQINDRVYRHVIPDFNDNDYVYEQIREKRVKINELKASEYVTQRINKDKKDREQELKRRSDAMLAAVKNLPAAQRNKVLRKPIIIPRTRLMEAAEFVFAETDGSNLKELLALPGIDKTRTTCNNMHTINKTLGRENARTFFIRALNNTIANTGSYVHPANIMFIAEFVMSRGEPHGATYIGISRQPVGHLSLATLEKAATVFTQNALHGRKEDIGNVSAAIITGARASMGDGSIDIGQKIVENGVPKTIMNDEVFMVHERDDEIKKLIQRGAVSESIAASDLATGLKELEDLEMTFDITGAEDATDLEAVFNSSEPVLNINVERQKNTVNPVVRRDQLPKVEAKELIDVLSQIKTGVPLPTGSGVDAGVLTAPLVIKPLAAGAVSVSGPIASESSGLLAWDTVVPVSVELGVPSGLEELLAAAGEITVNNSLPTVPIPQLPIEGGLSTQNLVQLRREQVSGLQPINLKALREALGQ